jgi:hypothetical protein
MSLNLSDIQKVANSEAMADHTAVVTGGGNFQRKLLPIGRHGIRLATYIELGVQDGGTYEGVAKGDEDQVRMDFEFLSQRVIETKEDGTQYAPRKSAIRKLSMHQKAGFYKLFMKMRDGDSNITHMSQMVANKAWMIDVNWSTKDDNGERIVIKKADAKKYEDRLAAAKTDAEKKQFAIYDNVDWNSIGAPMIPVFDPETGEDTGETKAVKIVELIGGLRFFLWDDAQPAFWDSLHIEGTYTKGTGDKEVTVSKNFIQETILGAKNFAGSSLEAMLGGVNDLPGMSEPEDDNKPSDPAPKEPVEPEDAPAGEPAEASAMDELFGGQEADDEIPF